MSQPKARTSHNALEIAVELGKAMSYEAGSIAGEARIRGKVGAFLDDQADKGHVNVNIDVLRKVLTC